MGCSYYYLTVHIWRISQRLLSTVLDQHTVGLSWIGHHKAYRLLRDEFLIVRFPFVHNEVIVIMQRLHCSTILVPPPSHHHPIGVSCCSLKIKLSALDNITSSSSPFSAHSSLFSLLSLTQNNIKRWDVACCLRTRGLLPPLLFLPFIYKEGSKQARRIGLKTFLHTTHFLPFL